MATSLACFRDACDCRLSKIPATHSFSYWYHTKHRLYHFEYKLFLLVHTLFYSRVLNCQRDNQEAEISRKFIKRLKKSFDDMDEMIHASNDFSFYDSSVVSSSLIG